MSYKYQHLTPGYLGEKVEKATLNSKFFSELFSNNVDLNKKILFPQKIPKTHFFEEMCALENETVKEKFDRHVDQVKQKASNFFMDANKNTNWEHGINLIRILMRYGCFKEIISIGEMGLFSEIMPIEFSYLMENARVDYWLSNDMPLSLDRLQQLSDKVVGDRLADPWLRCLILNRFIVSTYKFRLAKYKKYAQEVALILRREIKSLEITNTFEFMYSSLVYRGLAMVEELGKGTQDQLMAESVTLAKTAPANNLLEKLIVQDNLYPCLQSMAKWNMSNDRLAAAEECLEKMLELDPYDSTGFSELGIFLMKYNRFEEAGVNFKKAALLGAPGVGMNTYFYAKSLQELGEEKDAVTVLYEVTEIDKEAISPWLDLLDYYSRAKENEKVCDIARHIFQIPELKDELEDDEFVKIQTLLS